ncbi:hypothetical protein AAZV13_15G123700 [Glycine max]
MLFGDRNTLACYEFIPNGNLFQYLHDQNEDLPMTWDIRLRIATGIAGALFYLHSVASQPIYHRDIKSTNILLDEKYRAKIADFGATRMISIEDTHLTTVVQGQQPMSSVRNAESNNLASYFVQCMEEDNLFDIIDKKSCERSREGANHCSC